MHRPLLFCLLIAAAGTLLHAATAGFWQVSTQAGFLKGEGDTIAIDVDGRLTLGPVLTPAGDPASPALWRGLILNGLVHVGSGSDGKVFRFSRDGQPELVFDADELQVHALAAAPGGDLLVGTSPDGKVYRVAPDGSSSVFFDPEERFIWALASAGDGTVLVATGDPGGVYRVRPDGTGTRLYRAKATHVTAMVVESEGSLVIGTESPGQVIRLDATGKPFVLLDSPMREIRAISIDPEGHLLVAAMAGRQATDARPAAAVPAGEPLPSGPAPVPVVTTEVVITAIGDTTTAAPAASTRAADSSRDVKGVVYRIAPNGLWDEVWSSTEDLPYAVASDGSAVLVVTGNKGKVYRVARESPRVTLLARLPVQQITDLLKGPDDRWWLVTANPGKLFRLGAGRATTGTYVSEVFDAATTATWGTLRWVASAPTGTGVALHTRSGNTAQPDETWSEWSPAYKAADGEPIVSPNARFLQWKAVLTGKNGVSPVLTSVMAAYLPRNIRPRVTSITVHPPGVVFLRPYSSGEFEIAGFDAGTSDGRNLTAVAASAPAQTQPALGRRTFQKGLRTFVWKAEDGNDDKLQYDVYFRREGEELWRPLRKGLWDALLTWDTTLVADGSYSIRVVASDGPGNDAGLALSGEAESTAFVVDNSPPRIDIRTTAAENGRVRLEFVVTDATSPVVRVEYSLDAQRWQSVFPVDGINDGRREEYRLTVPVDGAREITVRAFDALDNVATASARVPDEPRPRQP